MLRLGVATAVLLVLASVSDVARAQEEPPRPEEPTPHAEGPPPPRDTIPPRTEPPPPNEVVAACVKSAEDAQTERSAHHLRSTRTHLLGCAQPTCPMVVRSDCATWLSEVDQLMPSVVIQARDTRGIELVDVRVLVDGQLITSHLDGLAVAVDPGSHLFQFEAEGLSVLRQQILIREGEKGRALPITLAAPTPAPAPAKPRALPPTATYVLGGIGIAGLTSFTIFAIKGSSDVAELRDGCGKTSSCTDAQIKPVHRELVAADVSLAVGLVSLAGALYFYLSDKPAPANHGVQPSVVVAPGLARVGVVAPF